MAEISTELQTIVNGRYGADIRMAIHDAIQKINISSGSGGGGVSHGPIGDAIAMPDGWDDVSCSGFANYRTDAGIEYAQDSSMTPRSSSTVNINVLGNHTVIGLAMCTGQILDITGAGSAWTTVYNNLVLTGQPDGVSTKLMVAVVKRTASYEMVTLNATTPSDEVLCTKLIVLNQNEDISSLTNTVIDSRTHNEPSPVSDTLYVTAAFENGNPTYTAYTAGSVVQATSGPFGAFFKASGSGETRFDYAQGLTFPEWGAALMTMTLT